MKTPIFAFLAVFATATIAESQTPKNTVSVAGEGETVAVSSAAPASATMDEIDLAAVEDGGKVELFATGSGEQQKVNIICEDATISEVLRQFRKTVKANIVSGESTNMSCRVSISLYDTPWLDSLKAILGMGGFVIDGRDGIYFVAEEQAANPVVRTKSFALNHASAEELAKLLNESFGEKDPKSGKTLNGVASVFKDANVVVVKGNDKMIRDCEEVIKSVDKAPPQVYIEARFMALSAEAMHKLGVQWNQLESWGATMKGMTAGYEQNGGTAANYGERRTQRTTNATKTKNHTESTSPGSSSWGDGGGSSTAAGKTTSDNDNENSTENGTYTTLTPSAIAEALGAGRSAESMGWANAGGFSGQLSVQDFNLALSAFEQFGEGKVFSNPKIIVSNGKQAKVDMTTKFPNVAVTASRSGNVSDSLDVSTRLEVIPGEDKEMFAKEAFYSWGISLSVTPRISPDGLINVEIVPTISSLDITQGDGGFYQVGGSSVTDGASSTPYSKFPIIEVKRLTTDFTMRDGATAVIGGLSQSKEQDVDSGIPYLRNIPWIGPKLFGWKSREKVQNEIIVFVTVGIANPDSLPKDVGLPKNAILGRDYVRGDKLEPGDRKGTSAEIMALDMRGLDERKGAAEDVAVPAADPVKKDEPKGVEEASGPVKGVPPPAVVPQGSGPSKVFEAGDAARNAQGASDRPIRHGRSKQ